MDFDAIVIGGGHAGIEASLALARLDFSTLLITQSLDAIGRLSCNPAIGGLSKGNIVREVDALGGEMARLIDESMIQFRILNRSRGPAVQAPRAQADKNLYSRLAKQTLELQKNLHLFQDTVVDIITDGDDLICEGVVTERGRRFTSRTVVMTTGTFMEGKIFIGDFSQSSGRLGEPAAVGLGKALRKRGYTVGRLKTGTPARVRRSSLDFSLMEEQGGDATMQAFSFFKEKSDRPQLPCHITYTNEKTHDVIRENFHLSPLFSGEIVGTGPRYCPSIEDKVKRFPDRERHQIFVEPEGLDTEEMYLNGISSSLPEIVQEKFLRTLPGLKNVEIMRPGYAVEYDYLDPTQLLPSLESKRHKGLFLAGQTNGTSGYEEAATQGLMAGINAARKLQGKDALVLSRAEAYTGVLIDDLVTLGTKEPYRMFTSRAEYRLSLRHDDADIRLFPYCEEIGLATDQMKELFHAKKEGIEEIKELLRQKRVSAKWTEENEILKPHVGKTVYMTLKDPAVTIDGITSKVPELEKYSLDWRHHTELDVKYEGYVARQGRQVARFQKMESMLIPESFDYESIDGISIESREKLKNIQPRSVGQASRISGVRSSDIAVLTVLLSRTENKKSS
ncbi:MULTISPECIES: tRNA uridine-5-carboxymethylaminomethyl(34) synthesis enzyme MnmG [unclassified Oceanispirochaeta]|uniref:tRNA uridine-5-carboxymethylaminomethyl(34) synthesis enzyme MnmG n=1 Tax=unclassified Oceanispirochaeta TaxID=2635722 RepID=UPI000E094DB7|nr:MULTISPECIES: tRNA uridine-5-carboxymethylaminomethyl(34) synthesis enzyme MnmG [unclassified Oceanispirochaeta]MBF9018511.1 tRNA uridine-5-carboxymethylaminomethyl(34) synthesis enzyme MnmG [Oceanispirochaeta sp. M2]NPD74918.1 tRNA uridine-5-carboxymethylaminomethyl(34) synthesis enzyme MnmG [Oceanispirochaeta sp. M1]RDG29249.1 tRNA uridine-5-carboxymethylaminomethyl(34) synthesis enzyme MnmG [Oceanispirochaeta sp. M1]